MAKQSMVEREKRRIKLSSKFLTKREKLKNLIKDSSLSPDEKNSFVEALQKLPRDSSKVRVRNRCSITGRPKGYYRKFGLGRTKLREAAVRGDIPGLVKASW